MSQPKIAPPELLLRFFRWFCYSEFTEDIEGDLQELFQRKVTAHGKKKAKFLFLLDVLKLFRPGIIKPFKESFSSNHFGMFRNYFITAIRNMRREKMFTFMNIAGLSLGMGCALVIYQIITHELSFDRYHRQAKNIYRIVNEAHDPSQGMVFFPGQVHPMGEAIRNDFTGVDAVMTFYAAEGQVSIENKEGTLDKYQESEGITFAEPNIFKIFDFTFIAGNPATALAKTGSVVLTRSLVEKYFKLGTDHAGDAIGKSLNLENKVTLVVTGVIADLPATTDLPFQMISNYKDQGASNPYYGNGTDWHEYNGSTNCYVMLTGGMSPEAVEQKLKSFQMKYSGKETADKLTLHLQPLSDLHTSATVPNYRKRQVTVPMLLTVGTIGIFLIVTAAINFINLSTAQATRRAREIGIRKTLGGNKGQLITQHIGETLLTSLTSVFFGLLIAEFLFQYLADVLGYQLSILSLLNLKSLMFLIALVIGMGLISGVYPALVLARLNPINALKNAVSSPAEGFLSIRRMLVIGQFVISQILIIGTIVVHLQTNFFMGSDPGFNLESILIMKLPEGADSTRLASLKTSLARRSDVVKVSFETRSPMAKWTVQNEINYPALGKDEHLANLKTADENYIDLYQLKMIAGRNYGPEKSYENAVVNRTLTKVLGFDDPSKALGEKFKYGRNGLEFTIIGVVEDFHAQSLEHELESVILANVPFNVKEVAVKLNTKEADFESIQETLRGIEKDWNDAFPERVFDFRFYDQEVHSMYKIHEMISKVSSLFAVIAIFIGALGLYALISWMIVQKTKEIGVRKVLGATVWSIQMIFSKEMLILILGAFAIAAPVSYFMLNLWLQDFAYKITLSPLIFLLSLLVSSLIALATIGYKSLVAAKVNPVAALKQE